MLKKILLTLLLLLAILAVIISIQPSEFNVSRTALIQAPASDIFTVVNDLHQWDKWSPWAKLDPNATHSFAGAKQGKGSIMTWEGNHEVGKGKMTITKSVPDRHIAMQLDFLSPFESTSFSEFSFKEDKKNNDQTLVTWSMSGHKNFISKAMGLIMNCEEMIGENFDQGLRNIRTLVEDKD